MIPLNRKIFRAYDIRGIYGEEITEDTAYYIGRGIGSFLERGKVVVGRDMRKGSERLRKELTKGLLRAGLSVINIGLSTTPMHFFAIKKLGTEGGIMVTASHNPSRYNGFKVFKDGEPVGFANGLDRVVEIIEKEDWGETAEEGTEEQVDVKENYVDFLTEGIYPAIRSSDEPSGPGKELIKVREADLKIAIDAGNGMTGMLLPDIMKRIGADYVPLFFKQDGSFPNREPDPLKYNGTEKLKRKMVESEAVDFGVAFDPDGDRAVFLTEEGELIPSDYILALLAEEELKKEGSGKVVITPLISRVVEEVVEQNNGKTVLSKVGHTFIKLKMEETGALIAGEESGHFYFKEFWGGDSGILTLLKIMEIVARRQKPLSEIIRPYKKYFRSDEIRFEGLDFEEIAKKLEARYKKGEISRLDGITVSFPGWWFNMRPSNTEPVVKLRVEAKDEEILERKVKKLREVINRR